METIKKYVKKYRVHVYETGPDGKVTIASLFNYLQDIASDHAEILGFGRDDLLKDNHFWVLSRMYAELGDLPEWEDEIIITTWPSGIRGIFLERNYTIEQPDGRLVAKASSSWLVIDRETKRIQRSDKVTHYNNLVFADVKSPVRGADKLEWDASGFDTQSQFKIRLSDLDVNYHTNNVTYIKWINDTYNIDFIKKYRPKSIEINYIAESMFGDDIQIKTLENGDGTFLHSVVKSADNKEICRAKIEWVGEDNCLKH